MSHIVFSYYFFFLHIFLFQPYDNIKREARHFGALKRRKSTTWQEKKWEKCRWPILCKLGYFFKFTCVCRMNEINILVLKRAAVWTLIKIETFNSRMECWSKEWNQICNNGIINLPLTERLRCFDCNLTLKTYLLTYPWINTLILLAVRIKGR